MDALYTPRQLQRELDDALYDRFLAETVIWIVNSHNFTNSDYNFTLSDCRSVDAGEYLKKCEDRIMTLYLAFTAIGQEKIAKKTILSY